MAQDTTRKVIDSSNFVDNNPDIDDSGEPARIVRAQVPKSREYGWGYRTDNDGEARTDYLGSVKNVELLSATNADRIIGTLVHAYTNFNEEEGFRRKESFDTEDVFNDSEPFPFVGTKIKHPHYLDVYLVPRRMEDNATDSLSAGVTVDLAASSYTGTASQRNL